MNNYNKGSTGNRQTQLIYNPSFALRLGQRLTRRFLNHSLRSERIQDFSTLPYGDHVSAFIIIQLVIIIIGNALKVTLSSTVSQIDFSVGTVEGLFTDLTIVQTHHYLVQKLENFIQERTLYPLFRGSQWICSSKFLSFMQIFAGWEMWKK